MFKRTVLNLGLFVAMAIYASRGQWVWAAVGAAWLLIELTEAGFWGPKRK